MMDIFNDLMTSSEDIGDLFEECIKLSGGASEDGAILKMAAQHLISSLEQRCRQMAVGRGTDFSMSRQMSLMTASAAGKRVRKFLAAWRGGQSGEQEMLPLLDPLKREELECIIGISCILRDKSGFSTKVFTKCLQEEIIPIEVIWKLHVKRILSLEEFILNNLGRPTMISRLTRDIVELRYVPTSPPVLYPQSQPGRNASLNCGIVVKGKSSIGGTHTGETSSSSSVEGMENRCDNIENEGMKTTVSASFCLEGTENKNLTSKSLESKRNGSDSNGDSGVKSVASNSSYKELRENILCDVMGEILSLGYEKNEYSSRPQDVERGLKKVCRAMLDNITKKYLSGTEHQGRVTDVLLFECVMEKWSDGRFAVDVLKKYCNRQLSIALNAAKSMRAFRSDWPLKDVGKWSLSKIPRFLRSAYESFLLPLSQVDIVEMLRQKLDKSDADEFAAPWYPALTFVSVFLSCFSNAYNLLDDLVTERLKKAAEQGCPGLFVEAVVLKRHLILENSPATQTYQQWFKKILAPDFVFVKKEFSFLMHILSDTVPQDRAEYLKIHIQCTPTGLNPGQRQKWLDYVDLVKTRLIDLKEYGDSSTGSLTTNQSSEAAIDEATKAKEKIVGDVDAAILSFTKSGKVPVNILEASIFKRPYFVGKFLPVLLEPRLLPVSGDARTELIDALHKANKISDSVYNEYKQACSNLEQQLLNGVFDNPDKADDNGNDDNDDEMMMMTDDEALQKYLDSFRDLYLTMMQLPQSTSHTNRMHKIFSGLSEKLCDMLKVDPVAMKISAQDELNVDLHKTDICKTSYKVAHMILNTFCQTVHALKQINNLKHCPSDLLSQFLSVVFQYRSVFELVCIIAYQLIEKADGTSAQHSPGLAAFIVHCCYDTDFQGKILVQEYGEPYDFSSFIIHRLPYRTDAMQRFTLRFALNFVWYASFCSQKEIIEHLTKSSNGNKDETSTTVPMECDDLESDQAGGASKTNTADKSNKINKNICFLDKDNDATSLSKCCPKMLALSELRLPLPRCIVAFISYLAPRISNYGRGNSGLSHDSETLRKELNELFACSPLIEFTGLISFSDWLKLESHITEAENPESLQLYYDWVIASMHHPLNLEEIWSESAEGCVESEKVGLRCIFSPSNGTRNGNSGHNNESILKVSKAVGKGMRLDKNSVGSSKKHGSSNMENEDDDGTRDVHVCGNVHGYCIALMNTLLDMDARSMLQINRDVNCVEHSDCTSEACDSDNNVMVSCYSTMLSVLQKMSSMKIDECECGSWNWNVLNHRIRRVKSSSCTTLSMKNCDITVEGGTGSKTTDEKTMEEDDEELELNIRRSVESHNFFSLLTFLPARLLATPCSASSSTGEVSVIERMGLTDLFDAINSLAGYYVSSRIGFFLNFKFTSTVLAALVTCDGFVGSIDDVVKVIKACPIFALSCVVHFDGLTLWIEEASACSSEKSGQISVAGEFVKIITEIVKKIRRLNAKISGNGPYNSNPEQGETSRGTMLENSESFHTSKGGAFTSGHSRKRKSSESLDTNTDSKEYCNGNDMDWLYGAALVHDLAKTLSNYTQESVTPQSLQLVLKISFVLRQEIGASMVSHPTESGAVTRTTHPETGNTDSRVTGFAIAVLQCLINLYTESRVQDKPYALVIKLVMNIWKEFPALIKYSLAEGKDDTLGLKPYENSGVADGVGRTVPPNADKLLQNEWLDSCDTVRKLSDPTALRYNVIYFLRIFAAFYESHSNIVKSSGLLAHVIDWNFRCCKIVGEMFEREARDTSTCQQDTEKDENRRKSSEKPDGSSSVNEAFAGMYLFTECEKIICEMINAASLEELGRIDKSKVNSFCVKALIDSKLNIAS